ncbi:unnamed protein product [Phytomonas sp. Hart1]|nr:unnamed protein product [Phytomonas sp. Hart1]|eukprot:CCW69987.1 unnamed protein product [Phytomonas sp. isolate Hart1]
MSTSRKKNVQDFQQITGLTEPIARECFAAFGNYPAALASFAQSYPDLPSRYFAKAEGGGPNVQAINSELRAIYQHARELKARTGLANEEVWRRYAEEAPPETKTANPFTTVGSFAAGIVSSPPAEKTPATSNPFAFGFGKPTGEPAAASMPNVFGFGKPTGEPAAASMPNVFGFGKPTGEATAKPMPSSFTGSGKPPKASAPSSAVEHALPPPKEPVEIPATHFTGPFFDSSMFWEEEVLKQAPLFNCNNGFIEANRDTLRTRMEKWLQRTDFYRKPIKYLAIDDEDEEIVRVIIKDADRTFFYPEHRTKLVMFLHAMNHEFKAYGQAMSYLSALCMLTMNEEEAASIIRFVSTEYIKGHWASEAVGFATSAWVVEHFMRQKFEDVAKHLDSLNLWPDTYLQKILTGLCVHVLSFNDLFDFLDAFMAEGLRYLIGFCLAIVEHYHDAILSIKSSVEANTLYEIMRLDRNVADRNDVQAILQRAPQIDLGDDIANIDLIRSQVYDKKVAPRLVRAPKTNTFEPCSICEERPPEWWNDDIGAVCSPCKDSNPTTKFENF